MEGGEKRLASSLVCVKQDVKRIKMNRGGIYGTPVAQKDEENIASRVCTSHRVALSRRTLAKRPRTGGATNRPTVWLVGRVSESVSE